MGMYKQMKSSFIEGYKSKSTSYKERLAKWNSEPTAHRLDGPTNITRARELGYKAKSGVLIVRVRVAKGKRKRPTVGGGRKPSKTGRFYSRQKSLQSIAEERAGRKFINTEVLNSYFIGSTGQNTYFEVILLNTADPSIRNDAIYSKIIAQKGRAFRALTASGRTHRGIA
jgi:large subunit ribosomal protein L15e